MSSLQHLDCAQPGRVRGSNHARSCAVCCSTALLRCQHVRAKARRPHHAARHFRRTQLAAHARGGFVFQRKDERGVVAWACNVWSSQSTRYDCIVCDNKLLL